MSDWHPRMNTKPVEWVARHTAYDDPYALIRAIEVGPPGETPELWFRAVTYAKEPERRELIGWCQTFDDACEAAYDYYLAISVWRRRHAGTPTHQTASFVDEAPAPADLLRAYRETKNRLNA